MVAKSYGQNRIKRALDNIRQVMARRQQRSSTVPGGDVYLGDLGHYCEEITSSWDSGTASDRPKFSVWHKDDQQKFCYLQYAIEVPYWELMLTLFAERHDNRADMTRVAIFRILESIKFSVLTEKKRLLAVLQELGQGDNEDLDAIVAGIDARIKALEGVQGGLDIKLLLETSGEKPQPAKELSNQLSVHQKELAHSQRNVSPLLVSDLQTLTTCCLGDCSSHHAGIRFPCRRDSPRLQVLFDIDEGRQQARDLRRLKLLGPGAKQHHGSDGERRHNFASRPQVMAVPRVQPHVVLLHLRYPVCSHFHGIVSTLQPCLELGAFLPRLYGLGCLCPSFHASYGTRGL